MRTYSALFDYISLPGVKKPLGQYGPAGVEDTTGGSAPVKAEEEDDDLDLFGSDEEEVSLMALCTSRKFFFWLCDELFFSPSFGWCCDGPFHIWWPVFVEMSLELVTQT